MQINLFKLFALILNECKGQKVTVETYASRSRVWGCHFANSPVYT